MAFVIPLANRTMIEGGRVFHARRPVEILDEGLYHHLIRTGRFRDPAKQFTMIRAEAGLGRVRPGGLVTIVREMGLGDVLMVLVVARALVQKYPRLKFRLATGRWFLPLLRDLGWLESVVPLMDLAGRVDNVLDLRDVPERHDKRASMDRIDIFASRCGVTVSDYTIPIAPVTDEERRKARELIGPGRVIALAARGSTHVRTWPLGHVQAFASLAASRGWTVAVLDAAPFEMPADPRIVNLTGKLSLLEVAAVIAESTICVSPDSGLQHVSEAVGTRCLALYSTTPPALRIGHYRHVKAIWRESLPCVPCMDRGCAAAPCMQIAPEVVMRAVENWDRLGMATNVDARCAELAPEITISAEREIMSSWIECAHCHA